MPLPHDYLRPEDFLYPCDEDVHAGGTLATLRDPLAAIRRDDDEVLLMIANIVRIL
jgi:hypothetical protein